MAKSLREIPKVNLIALFVLKYPLEALQIIKKYDNGGNDENKGNV